MAQAYINQRRLDSEAIQLEQNATNFQRQTSQWLSLVSSFTDSMKEVGHVQNWATTIEADMCTISTALEYAYKGKLREALHKGDTYPFVRYMKITKSVRNLYLFIYSFLILQSKLSYALFFT